MEEDELQNSELFCIDTVCWFDRELIVDSLLMEVGSALSHLSFIINILRMVFRAVTFYIPFFKLLMFYLNLQCLTQWRVNSFKFR